MTEKNQFVKDLIFDRICRVALRGEMDVCLETKEGRLITEVLETFSFNYEELPECTGFDWLPQPVKSPDDWVTQDRVPDRPGIDQWRRVWPGKEPDAWADSDHNSSTFYKHGDKCRLSNSVFEVRCRRKDLPPIPQETSRKIYVKLWLNQQSGHVSITDATSNIELATCDELKHDGTGFYLAE